MAIRKRETEDKIINVVIKEAHLAAEDMNRAANRLNAAADRVRSAQRNGNK